MKALLTRHDLGGYELTPINKRIAQRFEKDTGHESVWIRSDWDFPSLASYLGWNARRAHRRNCPDSRETDGTVPCPACGVSPGAFIDAAIEWLDRHDGHVFRNHSLDSYFYVD